MLPLESKWVAKPATRRDFTARAFMRSGCQGGMISAGLSPATRAVPTERISETKRERHTSPRAWDIRVAISEPKDSAWRMTASPCRPVETKSSIALM
ncbi:hypothetical protein D3C87_1246230 [compost metagenome]